MNEWSVQQIEGTNIYTVEIVPSMGPLVINEIHDYFQTIPTSEKVKVLGIFVGFENFKEIRNFVEGISMTKIDINRLEKYALLSNQKWFENVLEFEGKLFRGIEFKAFGLNQRDEAIEWLQS